MKTRLGWKGPGLLCLVLWSGTACAAGPPGADRADPAPDAVTQLARLIDSRIDAGLAAGKIEASPPADDAEFVRRVYLDLGGRIPRVAEARAFFEDRRSDKRARLVEKLLHGPNYVNHFTNVWRALLLPNNNNNQVQVLANQLETWARARLQNNVPYDRMVYELMTAEIGNRGGLQPPGLRRAFEPGAAAFYQVNESKADNLSASTSRLFLGVKIECAQCHDHPFARWTRKQFWEYTAFFAGIRPQNPQAGIFSGITEDVKVREAVMPGSEKKIKARFLDGKAPTWADNDVPRKVLADWMIARGNPFFARTAANRMWEHLFGIGLVDPSDDFREENPASHPELLDELANALVAQKYDMRFLIRAITASKAYQRTSAYTHPSQKDELRSFARMPLKGLTPEQVWESLATAVGYKGPSLPQGMAFTPVNAGGVRQEFLVKFANPVDRRTEQQISILQALSLMNGRFMTDATSRQRSETLAAVLDAPFMDLRQKLDTLYLAALSRPMRSSESHRLVPFVRDGGPSRDPNRALADVFWVLLNSSEFIFNH